MEMICFPTTVPDLHTGVIKIQAEVALSGLKVLLMKIGEWLEAGQEWKCLLCHMDQMISTARAL